jgi:hypothetical protein
MVMSAHGLLYSSCEYAMCTVVAGVLCGAAASGQFTWTPENVGKSLLCMVMSGPLLTGYTQVHLLAAIACQHVGTLWHPLFPSIWVQQCWST